MRCCRSSGLGWGVFLSLAFVALAACAPVDPSVSDAGTTGLHIIATLEALVVGNTTLQIELYDDEDGIEGAVLTVDPQMPAMGHGSSEVALVTELGDGFYEAAPIGFTMPGTWEITISAELPAREEPYASAEDGVYEQVFLYEVE